MTEGDIGWERVEEVGIWWERVERVGEVVEGGGEWERMGEGAV